MPRTEWTLAEFHYRSCILLFFTDDVEKTTSKSKGLSEITRKSCPVIFDNKQLHDRTKFGDDKKANESPHLFF